MAKRVWLLFALAFVLRLIALNQSLWLDEATTAKVVHLSFSEIIRTFSVNDFHPPLYYFLMKIWTGIAGYSEISLRLPSVLFSLAAGFTIYKIANLLKKGSGIWAAAFFLFNPLILYYSQEARMYMMIVLLMSLALFSFLQILKDNKPVYIIAFNTSIALSFLTFYGSILFVAAFYVYLVYTKRIKMAAYLLPGAIVASLIVMPLLSVQLAHSREALGLVKNWSLVLGKATLKNLFLIPLKFSIGRIQYYPKSLYYVTSGLWTLVVMFFVAKGALLNKKIAFFIVFPLCLGVVVSFFTPLLQYFRFLFLLVPMSILLCLGTRHRVERAVIAVGYLVCCLVYLLIPAYHREDWKTVSSQLGTDVYSIESSSDPIRYYRPDVRIHELRSLQPSVKEKKLEVVPYTAEIYGLNYAGILQNYGFHQLSSHDYRGVLYEVWSR